MSTHSIARVSASEVVRQAEIEIGRAQTLREQAKRIMEQADQIERETQSSAINALGHEQGQAAFVMAHWTVYGASDVADPPKDTEGSSSSSPTSSATHADVAVETATEVRPVALKKADESSPVPLPTHSSEVAPNGKISMFGVDVPPSRIDEAREIEAKAVNSLQQGRKSNPFSKDRGKNAWRKTLYNAVIQDLGPSYKRDEEREITISELPGKRPSISASVPDTSSVEHHTSISAGSDISDIGDASEAYRADPADLDVHDPLYDLDDELPPASNMPPPRGYPEVSSGQEDAMSDDSPSSQYANAHDSAGRSATVMHRPMPIQNGRRAAYGQSMQQPDTLPDLEPLDGQKGEESSSPGYVRKPPSLGTGRKMTPPSFMRKG